MIRKKLPRQPDSEEDAAALRARLEREGANSWVVRRRIRRTAKQESLAGLAEREYHARHTPAYRALLLKRIRTRTIQAAAVLMIGLGAWSSVGVQHSVANGAPAWSPAWTLGWVLEWMLLAGIAMVIIVRSVLASAGARLTNTVWLIEIGLLSLSLAANIHALPPHPTIFDDVMRLTGPVGCLLVSLVLVAVDSAIRLADIEVSATISEAVFGRWGKIGGHLADTVHGLADTAVRKVSAMVADTSNDSGADNADSGVREEVSASAASTDTRTDSGADSAEGTVRATADSTQTTRGHLSADTSPYGKDAGTAPRNVRGQRNADTVTADNADTEEIPRVLSADTSRTNGMSYANALSAARRLGADTVDSLSARKLADRLGCGRTLASRVRDDVLAEQARADDRADTTTK